MQVIGMTMVTVMMISITVIKFVLIVEHWTISLDSEPSDIKQP